MVLCTWDMHTHANMYMKKDTPYCLLRQTQSQCGKKNLGYSHFMTHIHVYMYVYKVYTSTYMYIRTSSDQALFMTSSLMMRREPWIRSSRPRLVLRSRWDEPSIMLLMASVYDLYRTKHMKTKEKTLKQRNRWEIVNRGECCSYMYTVHAIGSLKINISGVGSNKSTKVQNAQRWINPCTHIVQ